MRTDPTKRPGWVPPHCPNRKCRFHKSVDSNWVWRRRGFYTRQSDGRRIQRLQCGTCRVTFSEQTFSTTYWLKRPDLPRRIFMRVVGCMAARQIARDIGCSPETVNRAIARLGRHCMLLHMQLWRLDPARGPIVFDGFESVEYSQYHPIQHHVAVEVDTGFFLYHTDSELRRKGRMTSWQRRRRAEIERRLGRPASGALVSDVTELLSVILARASRAELRSDEHPSYPSAVRTASRETGQRVISGRDPDAAATSACTRVRSRPARRT